MTAHDVCRFFLFVVAKLTDNLDATRDNGHHLEQEFFWVKKNDRNRMNF